jgi:hypothetical protein
MKITAAILILVLLLVSGWWIQMDADSRMRCYTVENWNALAGEGADLYFTAVGWQSRTLVIHGDPSKFNGPPGVALVDSVVHSDLAAKLKVYGFQTLELNGVTKGLASLR